MNNENVTNTNGYLTTERMNTYHSQWCEQKLREHVESNKPETERKVLHKVTQRRNEKWLVTKSSTVKVHRRTYSWKSKE